MIRVAFIAAVAFLLAAGRGIAADVPISHEIAAQLNPASRSLEVTDVLTVHGREALEFRLASWVVIEALSLDGRPAEAERAGRAWRIRLPDTGEHRVEFHLAGTVPPLPEGGGRGDTPSAVADPEGSYLSGYAGWIPVTADDWTEWRLTIAVPAPQRAVSTGRLEEETLGETVNRAVFAAHYPADLPALFAGPYVVQERREKGIRLRTWFHEDLEALSKGYLDDAGRHLARYAEAIGPYPFQDFHIVSSPLPVGLGFPNLTYIGRMVLPMSFMIERSLAHEVLHNWWGNGVAPDYTAGNWSEGLTTYMADYALAVEAGADKALEMRLGWLRNYAALPAARDMPVTAFTSKRHDAGQVVGYDKVAFIFHMLRSEIGEAAFAKGLRLFWQQQRFRIAGWAELRHAFEEAADRDLGWFFTQWLDRAGAPRLELGDVSVRTQAGVYQMTLGLRQDLPAYRLSVPVLVDTDAGRESRSVQLEGNQAAATLEFGARPGAVHIDPDHDLFRRLLPGEAPPILRDVTLAPDTLTVIAGEDARVETLANRLAARLLDMPDHPEATKPPDLMSVPLLIVGITGDVESLLARAGLPGVPESLAGKGTARAWTAHRPGGAHMLVVAADDADALEALLRPLPHYGGKSYLVFEGRRAVETGIWPATESPLSRRLVADK